MESFVTTFDPANPNHKPAQAWGPTRDAWRVNAIRHAKRHGEAKVLLQDGTVLHYWSHRHDHLASWRYHLVRHA